MALARTKPLISKTELRRTPMPRGDGLKRTKSIARHPIERVVESLHAVPQQRVPKPPEFLPGWFLLPKAPKPVKKKSPKVRFPDRVKKLIRKRSGGRCEFPACHDEATEFHHRFGCGSGGDTRAFINKASNGVHCCHDHNQWVESNILLAEAIGMYLREGYWPLDHPVELNSHGWCLLFDDGTTQSVFDLPGATR